MESKREHLSIDFELSDNSFFPLKEEEIKELKIHFHKEAMYMSFSEMIEFLFPYRKDVGINYTEFKECISLCSVIEVIAMIVNIKAVLYYNKSKETK